MCNPDGMAPLCHTVILIWVFDEGSNAQTYGSHTFRAARSWGTSFQLQDYNWIPQSLPSELLSGFSYLTRRTLPWCGRKPCCHYGSLRSVLQLGKAAGCSREGVYASLKGLQQKPEMGLQKSKANQGG